MKAATKSPAQLIEDFRNQNENKKCFDCNEKVIKYFLLIIDLQGTTYLVTDFGIFVCSTCSGIHREMCHKVKGVGMSNFNEKEAEFVLKHGNDVK